MHHGQNMVYYLPWHLQGGTSKMVIHPILGILTMGTQKNIYILIPDNHLIKVPAFFGAMANGTYKKPCFDHGTYAAVINFSHIFCWVVPLTKRDDD